ncbi:MAG TPA: DNA polymerase III subunit chi [Pseudomonadales bacterium]
MKANFYLLKQTDVHACRLLACRLAEQQSKQGQRVCILADTPDDARQLDELLWSFTPESFVPHALADDPAAATLPVVVAHGTEAPAGTTCILNLGSDAPRNQPSLNAIAEFVANEDEAKARSRARWNLYKQLGYELQHHQL